MIISDEQLMAYVDGELDTVERAQVEQAMASDPDLARRVTRQQRLRKTLRATFDEVLREPVPERLLAAARNAPVAPSRVDGSVSDLDQARMRKAPSRRWAWPEWGAIAASVAVGAVIAHLLWRSPDLAPFTVKDGRLVAQAELAQSLSTQLASTQSADAPNRLGVSFRSRAGEYCRTFVTRQGGGFAGLACRQRDDWALQALSRLEPGSGEAGTYTPAGSSLPVAVLQAVQEQIAGEPLDAAAEAAALKGGWR